MRSAFITTASAVAVLCTSLSAFAVQPFRINVVDESNGWPVPLVELRTLHNVRFVSDNAGVIAIDLPELMSTETWFTVEGHGYSVPKDGFGFQGVRITPRPGESITIEVHRELAGKRLGRITGAGIFGESQKLGLEADWKEQGILGCDSVQNVVHNGRLFWNWGDTTLAHYPLGRFHMIGATTGLQPLESMAPPIRLRYDYFVDSSNVVRDLAKMPGDGPTWLNGYCSLPDRDGNRRLVATYSKIKQGMQVYEIGLCTWNERSTAFEKTSVIWNLSDQNPNPPATPHGHTVAWKDEAGKSWVLFGDPFPTLKCPATYEAWSDATTWLSIDAQKKVLVRVGVESIEPHRGSIAWNDFRKKWVSIFTQKRGDSSYLGEIWYAEADAPMGPWTDAVKVVTHNKYTFYNPKLHPDFAPTGSPILLFEATFTKEFSGNEQAVPRYDYNQVLYRLDLDSMP
jgi:hypothetical protein